MPAPGEAGQDGVACCKAEREIQVGERQPRHMSRLRARLPHLLTLWGLTAGAEGLLYYFFLSQPYFREFFAPFAVAALAAAAVASWRLVRPRGRSDRRSRERRVADRRAGG
jgi:hypothetical protein